MIFYPLLTVLDLPLPHQIILNIFTPKNSPHNHAYLHGGLSCEILINFRLHRTLKRPVKSIGLVIFDTERMEICQALIETNTMTSCKKMPSGSTRQSRVTFVLLVFIDEHFRITRWSRVTEASTHGSRPLTY